jgi:hypothetical protein
VPVGRNCTCIAQLAPAPSCAGKAHDETGNSVLGEKTAVILGDPALALMVNVRALVVEPTFVSSNTSAGWLALIGGFPAEVGYLSEEGAEGAPVPAELVAVTRQ